MLANTSNIISRRYSSIDGEISLDLGKWKSNVFKDTSMQNPSEGEYESNNGYNHMLKV